MAAMASRLNHLEQSSKEIRRELIDKEKECYRLRRRNEVLERSVGTDGADEGRAGGGARAAVAESQRLEAENERLRAQVLKSNGAPTWSSARRPKTWGPPSSLTARALPPPLDPTGGRDGDFFE